MLTILGYGARPYEKTSHSSTPKLQTSDLLENFCRPQDQGEEGPTPRGLRSSPCFLQEVPLDLTSTLWCLPLPRPPHTRPSGAQTQYRKEVAYSCP